MVSNLLPRKMRGARHHRVRDIRDMPLNKVMCKTCPFGPDGVQEIRHVVEGRCMTVGSQICHGTGNKTLCRGARDHQLTLFHRMGVLTAATDAAWGKAMAEVGLDRQQETC